MGVARRGRLGEEDEAGSQIAVRSILLVTAARMVVA
jgi:hypothetical protein